MTYTVKRPHFGDKMYQPGDKREIGNKAVANNLIKKGLLNPNYSTKEDKRAYRASNKAYLVSRGAGWYDIYRGGEQLEDSIRGKKKASKLRDEYNAQDS